MLNGAYIELSSLGGKNQVTLVQDVHSGLTYIRKKLYHFDESVYQSLMASTPPGLARIIEAAKDENGLLDVVEEYINGVTLAQYIQQHGPRPVQETAQIGLQLCRALGSLHSLPQPVVHRDVTLSNILRTQNGEVYLIDYNASRLFRPGAEQDTTIIGTPGYAPPEQFGYSQTDLRSDIYALGVVLNLLHTGHFPAEELAGGWLGKIISRCTAFAPESRFTSTAQVITALEQGLEGDPPPATKQKRRFWQYIPGFRTGQGWKMTVAVVGYLLIILFTSMVGTSNAPPWSFSTIFTKIWFFLLCLATTALYTNFLGVWAKLPLLCRPQWYWRALGLALATVFIGFTFFLLVGFLLTFFPAIM